MDNAGSTTTTTTTTAIHECMYMYILVFEMGGPWIHGFKTHAYT